MFHLVSYPPACVIDHLVLLMKFVMSIIHAFITVYLCRLHKPCTAISHELKWFLKEGCGRISRVLIFMPTSHGVSLALFVYA